MKYTKNINGMPVKYILTLPDLAEALQKFPGFEQFHVSDFYQFGEGFRAGWYKKMPDALVEQFGLICIMEDEDSDCGWQYAYRFPTLTETDIMSELY